MELYCEHCGALNGETQAQKNLRRYEYVSKNALMQSVRYAVVGTSRGCLCQFCCELPSVIRHYDYKTGQTLVVQGE